MHSMLGERTPPERLCASIPTIASLLLMRSCACNLRCVLTQLVIGLRASGWLSVPRYHHLAMDRLGVAYLAERMGQQSSTLLDETTFLYLKAVSLLDPVRLQVWEDMCLTFAQFRLLFRVRNNPKIDLRALAGTLGISASAASVQVDKLVDRGLLDRSEDQEDRRRVMISVTEAGIQITDEISRVTYSFLDAILSQLSAEDLISLNLSLCRVLEVANV